MTLTPQQQAAKERHALLRDESKRKTQRIRGLGDVVAKITTAVGIKPCGGCKERQAALNKAVPFK